MSKLSVFSSAAVVVGVIWIFVAGTVWQFLPIGAAIVVARLASKALEDKPSPEPAAPKKGKK